MYHDGGSAAKTLVFSSELTMRWERVCATKVLHLPAKRGNVVLDKHLLLHARRIQCTREEASS
jgi:hypothetical protein